MSTPTSSSDTKSPAPLAAFLHAALSRSATYVLMGVAILLLDLLTGRFLLFPILFVIPVTLSAWFCSAGLAYSLAGLLPLGRLLIAAFVENPAPLPYIVANALIRIAVLVFIAFLVGRTARQTRELKQRVDSLVTICAWSRTVEYQGEWISFEEYMHRRFNLNTSHGISPEAARKIFGETPSGKTAAGRNKPETTASDRSAGRV